MKLHTLTRISIAAAVLAFAGAAHANNFSHGVYAASKDNIKAMYKSEKDGCGTLSGNAKDICVEKAKGREQVALAQLEFNYTGKPKDEAGLYEAQYKADYAIAKEMCDDQSGNAKDVCLKEAAGARDKAKANLKLAKKVSAATDSAIETHMKADYKVAKEKCGAMSGNEKDVCVSSAKAWYHDSW